MGLPTGQLLTKPVLSGFDFVLSNDFFPQDKQRDQMGKKAVVSPKHPTILLLTLNDMRQ